MFKLGKTKIPHRKNTAAMEAVRMPAPATVTIPVAQNIGAPSVPCVKVMDKVYVGTKIADAGGYVGAPIHSSVSGTVKKIDSFLLSNGRSCNAIIIESDGEMTPDPSIKAPVVTNLDELCDAVRESGLVGLGGAGFPTSVKIDGARSGGVNTIVINAAECEPYITSDTRTMLDKPESVFDGISILEKCIPGVEKIIFGIEKNKPECIEEMARIFADNSKVSILPLPTLYPQGAEKVIVYNTTGRVVPEGKLPVDVGVLVMNVTSLAVLGHFVKTGMPLVEKCVTVDGSAVKEPKNVIVPIGTPIKDVIEFVGVDTENIGKILFGGPMMGIAACSIDEPITKRNNALTVMTVADANERDATACIHCGRCVENCPMNLNPTAYASALNLGTEEKIAKLEAYSINLCMECGCCSYVCPANRPLVQNNRLAKAVYRDYKAHKSTLK